MRYFKIKTTKEVVGGTTTYVYPDWYDSSKIHVLMYETSFVKGRDSSKLRGNKDEYMHCTVSDEDYADDIASQKVVTELTRIKFINDAEAIHETEERVNDSNKVLQILAKQARGLTLDQSDLNALDPDSVEAGVTRTPTFKQKVNDIDNA